MTSLIDTDAENVVGVRIDGKISEQEFDAITALMEEKMKDHLTFEYMLKLNPLAEHRSKH